MGTGAIYHWELENEADHGAMSLDWAVVSETLLAIQIAETAGGIIYCQEGVVSQQLAYGSLLEVLPEWSSPGPAFHIYYPSRRQLPSALWALIAHLKGRPPPQLEGTEVARFNFQIRAELIERRLLAWR